LTAAAVTGSVGVLAAVFPRAWLGLFTAEPAVLAAGELYLHIVGPTYAFFGLGLALYFAAQGAGHLTWPLVAAVGRLVIAVGAGWLAIVWLQLELPWLYAAIATAFVVFGGAQALSVRFVIRGGHRPSSP
jgi:Na+-driven multidrug efflux pump